MRAIRLTDPERLSIADVTRPEPGPADALVRVDAAGVCGSDVGAYHGKSAYEFLSYPRTLGHEYTGTVESVGRDVERVVPGDRVVERPLRTCGDCPPCRRGRENVCQNVRLTGFHDDGAFTEYVTVPAEYLHRVSSDVSVTRAAMVEPLSVAHRGVVRMGAVDPGERVLVLGPGPIGSLSALLADRAGADVLVVGLERDARRLDRLADCGLETAVADPDSEPPYPETFDVAIDATGSVPGIEAAVDAARSGGRVVVLGIPPGPVTLEGATFVRSETAILPSYAATARDFEAVIALQSGDRALGVEALADEFDPSAPSAAFEAFADGSTIKPIFEFDTV